MRQLQTENAVGRILAYDTTIVDRNTTGTLLKRGHTITEEDVAILKNSGVYKVWIEDEEKSTKIVYEWDIPNYLSRKIADVDTIDVLNREHGESYLFSKIPGLVNIRVAPLIRLNQNGSVLLITRQKFTAVGAGELIGVVDVVPLSLTMDRLKEIYQSCAKNIVRVLNFKYHKIGLVITGSEIYEGRKQDQYYNIIAEKAVKYGWRITYSTVVPDDEEKIVLAIREAREKGVEAIILTGGMSVDASDRTPAAVRSLGAEIIAYGIPVKPTTMSLVSYWDRLPIFGISAGGIFYRDLNAIDVIFTLMMAGLTPTRRGIAALGNGGILGNFKVPTSNNIRVE
jgi:hypothetical protein